MFTTEFVDRIEDSYARQCLRIVGSKNMGTLKKIEAYRKLIKYEPLYEVLFSTKNKALRQRVVDYLTLNNYLKFNKGDDLKSINNSEPNISQTGLPNDGEKGNGEREIFKPETLYNYYLNNSHKHLSHKIAVKYDEVFKKYGAKINVAMLISAGLCVATWQTYKNGLENITELVGISALLVGGAVVLSKGVSKLGSYLFAYENGFNNAKKMVDYNIDQSELKNLLNKDLDEDTDEFHYAGGFYFIKKSEKPYEERVKIAKNMEK